MTPQEAFTKALKQASFCYADDTCKDWDEGHRQVDLAARIAVDEGWSPAQVIEFFRAGGPHLVVLSTLERRIDALRKAVA